MKILVIGGTRNLGHNLVHKLVNLGHRVTVFNRGKTHDALPETVERLRGDRTDPAQLTRALQGRSFDVVVDNALYKGAEVEPVVRLFAKIVRAVYFPQHRAGLSGARRRSSAPSARTTTKVG